MIAIATGRVERDWAGHRAPEAAVSPTKLGRILDGWADFRGLRWIFHCMFRHFAKQRRRRRDEGR